VADFGMICKHIHAALEHFPKSVKRFLDKKCGRNKELGRETKRFY